eukprot:635915-Hanusia_phi.AAC.1
MRLKREEEGDEAEERGGEKRIEEMGLKRERRLERDRSKVIARKVNHTDQQDDKLELILSLLSRILDQTVLDQTVKQK